MKLKKLQLRDALHVANGGAETFLSAEKGYVMDFDQGLVTIAKADWRRLVPLANVAWMEPEAPAKAKAEKPA